MFQLKERTYICQLHCVLLSSFMQRKSRPIVVFLFLFITPIVNVKVQCKVIMYKRQPVRPVRRESGTFAVQKEASRREHILYCHQWGTLGQDCLSKYRQQRKVMLVSLPENYWIVSSRKVIGGGGGLPYRRRVVSLSTWLDLEAYRRRWRLTAAVPGSMFEALKASRLRHWRRQGRGYIPSAAN